MTVLLDKNYCKTSGHRLQPCALRDQSCRKSKWVSMSTGGLAALFSSDHVYCGAQRSRMVVIKGLVELLVLNNKDDTLCFTVSWRVWRGGSHRCRTTEQGKRAAWQTSVVRTQEVCAAPCHIPLSEDVLRVHAHSIFLCEGIFRQMSVSDIPRCVPICSLKHMLKECVLDRH